MMDDRRIMDEQLLHQIDACRTAGGELSQSDFAELADRVATGDSVVQTALERSRRLDRRIHKAMHGLAVPAGMASRLADKIADAERLRLQSAVTPVAGSLGAEVGSTKDARRRSWLWTVSIAASVLVAASCAFWVFSNGKEVLLTQDNIVDQAIAWESLLNTDAVVWNEQLRDVVQEFPLRSFRQTPQSWTYVEDMTGRPGVAYQFSMGRNETATVLVLQPQTSEMAEFLPFPPTTPTKGTAGQAVAAWLSGDRLYVVVLQNEEHYLKLVETAMAPPV